MIDRILFKRFETMSEKQVEQAIDFSFSREEQEFFSSEEAFKEEIDPERYIFVINENKLGTQAVIGFFSVAKAEPISVETSDSSKIALENILKISDIRFDARLSADDNQAIIDFILSLEFPVRDELLESPQELILLVSPAASKTHYYSSIEQAFYENQLICYKKIKRVGVHLF